MKTSLSHLEAKQLEELNLITQALGGIKKVEKVILFGSFARGDFVLRDLSEENGTMRIYESDYDILVIVTYYKDEQEFLIHQTIDELRKKYHIERSVSIIVESVNHVNTMLEENRYFYADIIKEGIMLFDTQKSTLATAKILTSEERKAIQKGDYNKWFPSANSFLEGYKDFSNRNDLNGAVFLLHQATERYITAYLLVKTGYRPKTHDLAKLYELLIKCDAQFQIWFDLANKNEERHFKLLKDAYVEARYSDEYIIQKEELIFLENKIGILKNLVEKLCIV